MQTVPEAPLVGAVEVTVAVCRLLGILAAASRPSLAAAGTKPPSQRALCLKNNSSIQTRLNSLPFVFYTKNIYFLEMEGGGWEVPKRKNSFNYLLLFLQRVRN